MRSHRGNTKNEPYHVFCFHHPSPLHRIKKRNNCARHSCFFFHASRNNRRNHSMGADSSAALTHSIGLDIPQQRKIDTGEFVISRVLNSRHTMHQAIPLLPTQRVEIDTLFTHLKTCFPQLIHRSTREYIPLQPSRCGGDYGACGALGFESPLCGNAGVFQIGE